MLWSIYGLAVWIDRKGLALSDLGYTVAGWALAKLEARR